LKHYLSHFIRLIITWFCRKRLKRNLNLKFEINPLLFH
jgi:hypothetical protein